MVNKKKQISKIKSKKNLTSRRTHIVIGIVVVVAALGLIGWSVFGKDPNMLQSRILVSGDMYWGREMHDWSQASPLKEKYPFSRLGEFHPENYDSWIANLECPSVPGVTQPVGWKDPTLKSFNCDTAYLPEMAKYIKVTSLANNHMNNQNGAVGESATRAALEKVGVQYFGGINPSTLNDVCEVIALPAKTYIGRSKSSIDLPVAMCGFNGVQYDISDSAIQQIQLYAKIMPVIAMPHMGKEYTAEANDEQRTRYRKMIDAGADVVIGNHPHWTQDAELYKGKLIAYSMGNFIFDQDFSKNVQRSVSFDIILSIKKGAVTEQSIKDWAELGKSCRRFKDTCLTDASVKNLPRLPVVFSYDIVGVDLKDKITKPAGPKDRDILLKRLGWDGIKKQGTVDSSGHVTFRAP